MPTSRTRPSSAKSKVRLTKGAHRFATSGALFCRSVPCASSRSARRPPSALASSPLASYPVRLENDLEGVIDGLTVEMFTRGQSGEDAEGAAERLKAEVAEIKPDLIVWQVGTNDAVARIDPEVFGQELRDTLTWLDTHNIDVVLIDPQYVERLSKDAALQEHRQRNRDSRRARCAFSWSIGMISMADLARQHPGSIVPRHPIAFT